MRVLHIYSGNLYGGIETMLATLARQRDLCPEMESHFALCFEGRLSTELAEASAPVYMLGNVRVSRPSSVRRVRRELQRLLARVKFDIVVTHSPWSQGIFGRTAKAADVPLVFWLHDAVDGRHWLQRWARRTRPDLVIANSNFTASTVVCLYSNVWTQVFYCPIWFKNGVLTNAERLTKRAEIETPDDAIVVIQVSRMEAWKGHVLHLEALAELRDVPGWVAWIVGGGQRPREHTYMNELKSMAIELGIGDRVRFTGERKDVPKLLAAADIFCQPNAGPEPFGQVYIEALHSGLPVVTMASGGALEIINESCGVLIEPGNKFGLSAALHELISDPERRASLGGNGPARASELCDLVTQMNRLQSILASVPQSENAG